MKVLGLIGGTSWVSTIDYYTQINKGINEKLGKLNFSECILYSFNFQEIVDNTTANDWNSILEMVSLASIKLEQAGAKAIILCANTIHYVADELETRLNIPVIHIAKETAIEIEKKHIKKVGLLGTKFTMDNNFFKSKLNEKGIDVLIPSLSDKEFIHSSIFNELGKGVIKDSTRNRFSSIIKELENNGAEGIIAGCTEIPLLINESDINSIYFDTTKIHTNAAIKFSLSE